MTQFSSFHPQDGNPTAAEIFRVFRDTTMASIEGLGMLLRECAELRGELVGLRSVHVDGESEEVFSARQQNRIVELHQAAEEMEHLVVSLADSPGSSPHDA